MALSVQVKRLKNRSMTQFYRDVIQHRQRAELTSAVQKIGVEAKRQHTYQNRTGALESSIRWVPAMIKGDIVEAAVSAGGFSTVRFATDITTFRQTGKRVRNRRVVLMQGLIAVRRGHAVFVDYARAVEKRGYSVLTDFVNRAKGTLRKVFGPSLKVERV